jgi:molybdopterin/thiamine biosynthesis adenylyltransferase/rhodanese-related sulfurtransferase
MLIPEERARYARHLLLPQVGEEGQERLKAASILVVGAGGLGAPLLQYLAAAGVGRIGIVDDDVVSASNLQRQVLFGTQDVGRPKVEVAAERLNDINPHIRIEPIALRFTRDNALDLVSQYDLVADGTDNFATRYLVNDACVLAGRPNIYASIFRFDGQVSVFGAEDGPCYRCLFPEPPPPGTVPSCAEGGVLGVLPGLVGSLQATEAIKWILRLGQSLAGRLLLVDALTMDLRTLRVPRDPSCPVCGEEPTIRELQDYEAFCAAPSSESSTTADPMFFGPRVPEISVQQLHAKQQAGEDFLLLDVRHPEEQTIAHIGGTLVPMDQLPVRLPELAPDQAAEIVVMCRSGSRSAHVVAWMMQQGYTNVFNLSGGTNAWSRNIDPSVPVY